MPHLNLGVQSRNFYSQTLGEKCWESRDKVKKKLIVAGEIKPIKKKKSLHWNLGERYLKVQDRRSKQSHCALKNKLKS